MTFQQEYNSSKFTTNQSKQPNLFSVPPPPTQLGTRGEEESSFEEYAFKEDRSRPVAIEEHSPVPAIEIDLCDPEVVSKLSKRAFDRKPDYKTFKY